MMHHLTLFPWRPGLSFLPFEQVRFCGPIVKMLNLSAFVGGPVNPARRGRFNPMLP